MLPTEDKGILSQSNNTHGKVNSFSFQERILVNTLFVIVTLTSIFGNAGIVFTIFRDSKLCHTAGMLLLNFCICNVVASIGVYPYVFTKDIPYDGSDIGAALSCTFIDGQYMFYLGALCGKVVLALIALHRFLVMTFPYKMHNRWNKTFITKVCIITWVATAILTAYYFFTVTYSEELKACVHDYSKLPLKIYRVFIFLVVLGTPSLTLILSFVSLRQTTKSTVAGQDTLSAKVRRRKYVDAVRMAQVLVIISFICWLPFVTYYLLSAVSRMFEETGSGQIYRNRWIRMTTLFATLNAAIDTFPICKYNSGVRLGFKNALRQLCTQVCKRARVNNRELEFGRPSWEPDPKNNGETHRSTKL